MRYYRLRPTFDEFLALGTLHRSASDLIYNLQLSKDRLRSSWSPIDVEVHSAVRPLGIREADGLYGTFPDCIYLCGAELVFSQRAVTALHELMKAYSEFLPLRIRSDARQYPDVYLVHVTNEIDALDPDRSVIEYCGPAKRTFFDIRRYEFKATCLTDVDLFRIPTRFPSFVFASERIVDRIHAAGLEGFSCTLVWPRDDATYVTHRNTSTESGSTSAAAYEAARMSRSNIRMLDAAEHEALEVSARRARNHLGMAGGEPCDAGSVHLIATWIDSCSHQVELREEVKVDVGVLWGHCVCQEADWQWAMAAMPDGSETIAIISPSHSHMVLPTAFIENLLTVDTSGNRAILLFNMLTAGRLPSAFPGDLLLLS